MGLSSRAKTTGTLHNEPPEKKRPRMRRNLRGRFPFDHAIAGLLLAGFQLVKLGDDGFAVGLDLFLAFVAAEIESTAFGRHLRRLAHRPQVVCADRADS